jgi:hypothetical protein
MVDAHQDARLAVSELDDLRVCLVRRRRRHRLCAGGDFDHVVAEGLMTEKEAADSSTRRSDPDVGEVQVSSGFMSETSRLRGWHSSPAPLPEPGNWIYYQVLATYTGDP